MTIRSSSAREIERLIGELRDGSAVERDAAAARLRVIGPRAVERLSLLAHSDAPAPARAAALRALEGIHDGRVRDVALAAIADPEPAVTIAAIAAARAWLGEDDDARVLDALTAVALDRSRDGAVRLAALDALSDMPSHAVQEVVQQVRREAPPPAPSEPGPAALDTAADVREWLREQGAEAPLSSVHHLIAAIRERERSEPSARRRQEWEGARAAAHALLATRGSRVALYDLKETLDRAQEPLPADFLTAATRIGDASCLEPLARAWAASPAERSWREDLANCARAIMRREKLTARHAAVKRVRTRYPEFL